MTTLPILCKDCKHYEPHRGWEEDRCLNARAMRDIVRGTTAVLCAVSRMHTGARACGPRGRWFEPKDNN